ncbi:MAG: sensor histidine kinase [Luteolibacter sp.]
MRLAPNRNLAEWLFVGTMVGVCGILALLQYRWTGDVARAEITLMRDNLSRQSLDLCKEFDAEISKSRALLVPTLNELEKSPREKVYAERMRRWKSQKRPPVFKRMAVVVQSGERLELLEMHLESETLVSIDWPIEWEEIHANHAAGDEAGLTPTAVESGLVREFSVTPERRPGARSSLPRDFSVPGGPGPARDREWVILELDADYLRNTWLPALVTKHLNPKENILYHVVIRSKEVPENVIYATGPAAVANGGKAVAAEFNYFGAVPARFRNGPPNGRWIMEVAHCAGSVESLVAGYRMRNLAIALALNGLILASGWMLLRNARRSRHLAEEQMRFVANVTHELRTPLTVIRGAAHNLKRGIIKDPGGIARYSGLIIEHAESLGAMVEQVLDFSGDRRGAPVRQPLELGEVLHDAASVVKSDARFSSCQIDIHLPASIPVLMGDADALRRAFQNLLENAAKHGGAGEPIGVTVVVRDRVVDVMVEDRGPGISADELTEIFTPFFRGNRARSGQIHGSGLGLSLVRETAKAHGGDVTVRSEPNKGSTFTLSLPR